jgi:hypothetical protein
MKNDHLAAHRVCFCGFRERGLFECRVYRLDEVLPTTELTAAAEREFQRYVERRRGWGWADSPFHKVLVLKLTDSGFGVVD